MTLERHEAAFGVGVVAVIAVVVGAELHDADVHAGDVVEKARDDVLNDSEAVSVLGYPSGSALLERGTAVMAPSTGSVRKVEANVFIDSSILPGNSGGPVIDIDGNVIAIATKNNVDSSMGICIPSREIVKLLKRLRGR